MDSSIDDSAAATVAPTLVAKFLSKVLRSVGPICNNCPGLGTIRNSSSWLCVVENNRFHSYNNSQMWVYALGVTLRQALRPSSTTGVHVIRENQRQPVISQQQLKADYYQGDRQQQQRMANYEEDEYDDNDKEKAANGDNRGAINCSRRRRQQQHQWNDGHHPDKKTNTHGK